MRKLLRRFWEWCLRIKVRSWLVAASLLTLVALALMTWSLFDPTLVPIIIGMSLAQVFGTIAFAIYGVVVFLDLTRQRREEKARRAAQTEQAQPEKVEPAKVEPEKIDEPAPRISQVEIGHL